MGGLQRLPGIRQRLRAGQPRQPGLPSARGIRGSGPRCLLHQNLPNRKAHMHRAQPAVLRKTPERPGERPRLKVCQTADICCAPLSSFPSLDPNDGDFCGFSKKRAPPDFDTPSLRLPIGCPGDFPLAVPLSPAARSFFFSGSLELFRPPGIAVGGQYPAAVLAWGQRGE